MSKWEKRQSELMGLKEFAKELREWGLYVACSNWLIAFTKWFIGAKRIQITYFK